MKTKTNTDRAEMVRAWRLVTRGLNINAGACQCALCGDSPHPAEKSVQQFLPAHFPFPDLVDPSKTEVCAGCVKIFGGKPSKTDPPLRTRHVAVVGGEVRTHKRVGSLYPYLLNPDFVELLSWGTSQKKHHLVYARVRESSVLYIGSDDETLVYGPAERALFPVISELLEGFDLVAPGRGAKRGDTIINGSYSSHAVQKFGANRWAALEAKIDPLRRRSPLLLQLMTYASPKPDREQTEKREETVKPEDSTAAFLLGEIAHASAFRRAEGLKFWGGFFLNRIQRFRRLDLPTLVSKLLEDCQVAPHQADGVTSVLLAVEADGDTEAVSQAIRERPSLLAALAYDHVQTKKPERSPK